MKHPVWRAISAVLLLVLLLVFPLGSIHAAAEVPVFAIIEVKAGETVTVHTWDFPADRDFVVRMGKNLTQGINGIEVETINSGEGGSFEKTFSIPAELKAEEIIAIRMDNQRSGYYAFNWFVNKTGKNDPEKPVASPPGSTITTTTKPPALIEVTPVAPQNTSKTKALLTIVEVKKDVSVRVRADNLPANQDFTVRIGTYYNFFRDYEVIGTINSGKGGSMEWTSSLPEVTKGVKWVTVRIDSAQKVYAFNAFINADRGSQPSAAMPGSGTGSMCAVVAASPATVSPGVDYDIVWDIRNTSGRTLEAANVDFVFVSGDSRYEGKRYDLAGDVSNGDAFRFVVDMTAPSGSGKQTEHWVVVQGEQTLCDLNITVDIK